MSDASMYLRQVPGPHVTGAARGKSSPRSNLAISLTLAAMSLGYGVVQLDVTIVNTALNSIGTSLGGGVSELQWVVNSYTITFAAFILTAGALGDRIGAKRIFMAGFAIFTAASLACALSPNAMNLIAARAMQGFGAAALVPNSLALLNHAYPDDKGRGRAVGIWAAGASLALISGPLIGGALIALVGWRWIFLVNLPIGLAALWLSWRYVMDTKPSPQREVDLPGQIAAIVALGCLAGAIIEGGARGWSDIYVIAGFVASALLAALFVLQERRAAQPMLPLSLFASAPPSPAAKKRFVNHNRCKTEAVPAREGWPSAAEFEVPISLAASSLWELQFEAALKLIVARAPLIPKFASKVAAITCELRNRSSRCGLRARFYCRSMPP
jgi:MFS transporter, DHA2 family, methylenomycin A resistance protein